MRRVQWMPPTRAWVVYFAFSMGLLLSLPMAGRAQEGAGYGIGENTGVEHPTDGNNVQQAGPVRLARFAYVSGNVTWRGDDGQAWSQATVNLPLRQGAQIWVTDGGRAEIQFDDGSLLRLGNGALVTLQTLFSDADGEFTEIKMTEGLASLQLHNERSVYQVDTPFVSVKANGEAKMRLGVRDAVEVAVRQGRATVEGIRGKTTLESGDYLDLPDPDAAYDLRSLPQKDSWDRWNDDRDRIREDESRPVHRYLPENIAPVAAELDDYGTWRHDTEYGEVWCPRVTAVDWRPYQYGHWTWVSPFGWTWVSQEPWGWAPYHYGTWTCRPYGWAWVPGPSCQYWSPAVVHFSECDGQIAWAPLAPAEVRYPASFGFSLSAGSGNWRFGFSIWQTAVYYPTYGNVCVARPWNNVYVNRARYVTNVTNVTNTTVINNFNRSAPRFVPLNARNAAGVTLTSVSGFGGQGSYQAAPRAMTSVFDRGRVVSLPSTGTPPIAGPLTVAPTQAALTPTRSYLSSVQPSQNTMNRSVYRTTLPPQVARGSAPVNRGSAAAQLNARYSGTDNPSGASSSSSAGSAVARPFRPGSASGSSSVFGSTHPLAPAPSASSAGASAGTPSGLNGRDRQGVRQPTANPSSTGSPSPIGSVRSTPPIAGPAEQAARARESLGLSPLSRRSSPSFSGSPSAGNSPSGSAGASSSNTEGVGRRAPDSAPIRNRTVAPSSPSYEERRPYRSYAPSPGRSSGERAPESSTATGAPEPSRRSDFTPPASGGMNPRRTSAPETPAAPERRYYPSRSQPPSEAPRREAAPTRASEPVRREPSSASSSSASSSGRSSDRSRSSGSDDPTNRSRPPR